MPESSDDTTKIQDYLARIQGGDDSARDAIIGHACDMFRQQTQRMLRTYPHVKRWEETDDVLNQAMLRLHRALGDVELETARQFHALAATQIRRQLIDLARHYYGPQGMGANHATEGGSPESHSPPLHDRVDDTFEPSQIAEWAEYHQQVEALPEDQREVFSLRWYDGKSFVEIAEIIGIAERTVMRRWRRACVTLHQAMQGERPGC